MEVRNYADSTRHCTAGRPTGTTKEVKAIILRSASDTDATSL